jgi:hypothetical protein
MFPEQDEQDAAAEDSNTETDEAAHEDVEQESKPQEGDDDSKDDWRNDFDPEKAREKIRKQNSELKGLRNRAKEAEEKAKGADEKDQQISAQEATILRYEVAFDLGLPKELASRLRGNDREEMLKDAEALLELVSTGKRPPTKRPAENLRGGGEPEREPEETDLSKLGARMFRR